MNLYVRMVSALTLLATALLGLSQYRPAWAAQAGFDWWSLPEVYQELRRGEQESAALAPRTEAALERLRARVQVIEDLRAGRLTLVQAAAHFRRLNALPAARPVNPGQLFAGATEEERLCRQVIFWADAADRNVPSAVREQTRRRLEAELECLLASDHGLIQLRE
jgi:hypothetical protein